MSLVQAPALGIERFAAGQRKEHRPHASNDDLNAIIRAVYQQVLGGQYLMTNERLGGAESLFRNGYLNVRELVRTVAKSALYRSRFFENCNPYRFIELNHKHLLGRAPQNKEEMLHHFTILQEQGYDAEIDSYLDSAEYNRNFGNDTVPHLHGWNYAGDGSGTQFKLGRALHQNRPVPVAVSAASRYAHISTDGPFRAATSDSSELPVAELSNARRIDGTPAYGFRSQELLVSSPSAGAAGEGSRVVTITATGIANNRFLRHGAYTTRVPFSRMNEALQRVIRQGGRVVSVVVSGEGELAPVPVAAAPKSEAAPKAEAAPAKGKGRAKKG